MHFRWPLLGMVLLACYLSIASRAYALETQYVVINFSTINEEPWAAPEPEWQSTIKPRIIAELNELIDTLPAGTDQRQLAWSTLLEYMNFPLDTPSENSVYVIKVHRIFEIAREVNLPVFLPLNGFQWWDELPELYNWWDPDGTHTDPQFFARQDNPEDFKRRFVAGYHPENKWNVEWQDHQTPMQLNYRNWGGGGFRLAPPPNLMWSSHQAPLQYRRVLYERLHAILTAIQAERIKLTTENRSALFVGISLGTEISLNASVTPEDEFMPYGYRALSDYLCPGTCITSPTLQTKTTQELHTLRGEVVNRYLTELSEQAIRSGLPKYTIYTHVWGEALPADPKYSEYAASAVNPYARPGISLYGFAEKPWESEPWYHALQSTGWPTWGAVETSIPNNSSAGNIGLGLLDAKPDFPPPHIIVLYNWSEHRNTAAIPVLQSALHQAPPIHCTLSRIQPVQLVTQNTTLEWEWLDPESISNNQSIKVEIWKGPTPENKPFTTLTVPTSINTAHLPQNMSPGLYTWQIKTAGCESHVSSSPPAWLVIPHHQASDLVATQSAVLKWLMAH